MARGEKSFHGLIEGGLEDVLARKIAGCAVMGGAGERLSFNSIKMDVFAWKNIKWHCNLLFGWPRHVHQLGKGRGSWGRGRVSTIAKEAVGRLL